MWSSPHPAECALHEGDGGLAVLLAASWHVQALPGAGINILAGATLGGGTRVNWSASFRTPDHVRREWAQKYDLPVFEGARFDAALDAVCKRIGVSTGVEQGWCAVPLEQ